MNIGVNGLQEVPSNTGYTSGAVARQNNCRLNFNSKTETHVLCIVGFPGQWGPGVRIQVSWTGGPGVDTILIVDDLSNRGAKLWMKYPWGQKRPTGGDRPRKRKASRRTRTRRGRARSKPGSKASKGGQATEGTRVPPPSAHNTIKPTPHNRTHEGTHTIIHYRNA